MIGRNAASTVLDDGITVVLGGTNKQTMVVATAGSLAAGDKIKMTQSAIVLENLISQFLYSKAAEGKEKE